jgi:hypothetical protein
MERAMTAAAMSYSATAMRLLLSGSSGPPSRAPPDATAGITIPESSVKTTRRRHQTTSTTPAATRANPPAMPDPGPFASAAWALETGAPSERAAEQGAGCSRLI